MVAHNIYGQLHPEQDTYAHPPPEEVAAIKKAYASTTAFLLGTLGPRPLWLNTIVIKRPLPPIPDAELAYAGKPLPGAPRMLLRLRHRCSATPFLALRSHVSSVLMQTR